MFKMLNRPEVTINTIEEVKALKPFFDGKKHRVVFCDAAIYYSFYKELFEKCRVNNFFANQVSNNGDFIKVNNVPVSEVSDENKDELIEKHNIPIDENIPFIDFEMTAHCMKDGKWDVTFKVDSEIQKYWDPKPESIPEYWASTSESISEYWVSTSESISDPDDDKEPSVDKIAATIDIDDTNDVDDSIDVDDTIGDIDEDDAEV